MACKECYKFKRCFERRGVCAEYRSLKEIREAIRKANDDWNRYFGDGITAVVSGPGKDASGKDTAPGED